MPIKSFRGLLADGQIQEINLRTNNGKIGYRILKLELFPGLPGAVRQESTCKLYSINPGNTADAIVNFEDQDLLASAFVSGDTSAHYYPMTLVTIFDNITFNQNIFITHKETYGSEAVNYYLELEQIKLNDNESTMATLQSIRSRYESYTPAGPT